MSISVNRPIFGWLYTIAGETGQECKSANLDGKRNGSNGWVRRAVRLELVRTWGI